MKKRIHPIYFNSFVGTWKRVSINGQPADHGFLLKFKGDCTYEEVLTTRGTVNGDVDEVSVDGELVPAPGPQGIVKGKIKLKQDMNYYVWNYTLDTNPDVVSPVALNRLKVFGRNKDEVFRLQIIAPGGKDQKSGKKMVDSNVE